MLFPKRTQNLKKHRKMKNLEPTCKFELEPKPTEANGRFLVFLIDKTVSLTQELWKEKTSQNVEVFNSSYSQLSKKVLCNLRI